MPLCTQRWADLGVGVQLLHHEAAADRGRAELEAGLLPLRSPQPVAGSSNVRDPGLGLGPIPQSLQHHVFGRVFSYLFTQVESHPEGHDKEQM